MHLKLTNHSSEHGTMECRVYGESLAIILGSYCANYEGDEITLTFDRATVFKGELSARANSDWQRFWMPMACA